MYPGLAHPECVPKLSSQYYTGTSPSLFLIYILFIKRVERKKGGGGGENMKKFSNGRRCLRDVATGLRDLANLA